MGAQNHQPTNRVMTPLSAWLSQRVCEGHILLLSSNNHLEDAIMLGMDKLHVDDLVPELSGTCSSHLNLAISDLEKLVDVLPLIDLGFSRLDEVAKKVNYQGNPLAKQIKSFKLYGKFSQSIISPRVNQAAWEDVQSRIAKFNIMKTLAWEADQFAATTTLTRDFIAVLRICVGVAESEGGLKFANAVEDNEIPVRQVGGKLIAHWNYLNAMFLYSSLMMTELFYKVNSFPSLLDFRPQGHKVSAA